MKAAVVIFPGSNCDRDIIHVLQNVMGLTVESLWHKDDSIGNLKKGDMIVLPGGFSFGDYLRTGAIAKFSPVMKHVIEFARNGGLVLGICNGFQVLCECGLLPGALLRNDNQQFICKNVHVKVNSTNNALLNQTGMGQVLKIPIAHAEGRFFASAEQLKELSENDQILLRYCDSNGQVNAASNPNGSSQNIAGICNAERNVYGMMPHPERAAEAELGNTDGKLLFESICRELVC